MIQGRDGHTYYEIEDLALLWGTPFARHVWDLVVTGRITWLGLSDRTGQAIQIPTETADYDTVVRDIDWPDILSSAMRIADQEGVR